MKLSLAMCLGCLVAFSTALTMAGTVDKCGNFYPVQPMPPKHYGKFLMDRLEYSLTGKEKKVASYETTLWYGGDYNRVWLEAEGDHDTGSGSGGEVERLDLMVGRLISPFWDVRLGGGYMGSYGGTGTENRTFLVGGLKGLAPYFFEIDTNFRISNQGESLLDFEAEYDILLTQRLIFQPRMDALYSLNPIRELGIGTGLTGIDLSFRLRYEIRREFAPYIGLSWSTKFGSTRDILKEEGDPRDVTKFFLGLRFWF